MKEQESKKEISLRVNGKLHTFRVPVSLMLVDLIRDELGLTGTKVGCRKGECGACNILVNGELFSSCLYPAIRADGKSIVTIEGLKREGRLHPLQKAFIDRGAVQCGFCTPGMIISAKALLDENSNPSLDDIRKGLSGNLCRCGGYQKILKAVLTLVKRNHR